VEEGSTRQRGGWKVSRRSHAKGDEEIILQETLLSSPESQREKRMRENPLPSSFGAEGRWIFDRSMCGGGGGGGGGGSDSSVAAGGGGGGGGGGAGPTVNGGAE